MKHAKPETPLERADRMIKEIFSKTSPVGRHHPIRPSLCTGVFIDGDRLIIHNRIPSRYELEPTK